MPWQRRHPDDLPALASIPAEASAERRSLGEAGRSRRFLVTPACFHWLSGCGSVATSCGARRAPKSPCRPGRWSSPPRRRPDNRDSSPSTSAEAGARPGCRPSPDPQPADPGTRAAGQTRVAPVPGHRSRAGGASARPAARVSHWLRPEPSALPRPAVPQTWWLPPRSPPVPEPRAAHCPVAAGRPRRRAAAGLDRVDRLNACERRCRLLRLVRLEVADEMPPCRAIGGVGNLLQAFLYLFSPNSRCPAAHASRMQSAANVFDTATSVISDGCRPARRADSAIRSRTSARLLAIDMTVVHRFRSSRGSEGSRTSRAPLNLVKP